MRRSLATLFIVTALGLTACLGRSGPAATATPLPLFTATQAAAASTATVAAPATAAPSPTVVATETPTSTASAPSPSPSATTVTAVAGTATPAVTATPDPNEAVGDVVYQDKLDGKGGWFWTFSDDVANFGVVDGKLKGVMKAANSGWRFTISQDTLRLASQQVSLGAHTVSCGPNDEYGLMFRLKADTSTSTPAFDGYLFKLRCDGMASFQVISGTQTTTLVGWTPSPAIKMGAPADNTLLVWAAGSQFRFYANGQYLFSAQDSTLTAGFYGIYLYDRTKGGETVNFDNLVAHAVSK